MCHVKKARWEFSYMAPRVCRTTVLEDITGQESVTNKGFGRGVSACGGASACISECRFAKCTGVGVKAGTADVRVVACEFEECATVKNVVGSAELSANQGGPEPWGPGSIRYRDCAFSNQANPKLYGDVKEDPELTQEDDFDDELVPNSTRESARLVHFNSLSLREGERPSRTHLTKMESCITSPRKAVLLLTTTRT
jgi:hypothetical protein